MIPEIIVFLIKTAWKNPKKNEEATENHAYWRDILSLLRDSETVALFTDIIGIQYMKCNI